jgi:hypothetical protein
MTANGWGMHLLKDILENFHENSKIGIQRKFLLLPADRVRRSYSDGASVSRRVWAPLYFRNYV